MALFLCYESFNHASESRSVSFAAIIDQHDKNGSCEQASQASYEYALISRKYIHILLKGNELTQASLILDTLLDINHYPQSDDVIADILFEMVKYYCKAGRPEDAFKFYMYSCSLINSVDVINSREKIREYLKQNGVQESADTYEHFLY
jgi:hypothetical protein